jgi:hypothetical protein
VLYTLHNNKPGGRWCDLATIFHFEAMTLKDPLVKFLIAAASARDIAKLSSSAVKLLARAGQNG